MALLFSCDQEQDDLVTEEVALGGLLEVMTPVISHVKGERPTYSVEYLVYQGEVKTTQVEIYKQFSNAEGTTDKQLMKSIAVDNQSMGQILTTEFTYDDLALDVPGLPENDADLVVGDKFILTYQTTTSEGNKHWNVPTTEVGVSSPFAGVYNVIESDYWRIGVQSGGADWTDQTRVVKSVDPTTLQHVGWGPWVPEQWPTDPIYLYLYSADESDITVLKEWDGEVLRGPGDVPITCAEDGSLFTNVPCEGSNVMVFKDDGKHTITITYGYEVVGSGYREFYEKLEKIVE